MPKKRPALGRGLSALIPDVPVALPGNLKEATAPTEVDLDLLQPNGDQPRNQFNDESLSELSQSIKVSGVIQPILVRPGSGGTYEIVAGERRWRAAQRAGLMKVPVVVRNIPDEKRLELALVENIQRENLNPIEEARAYKRLSDIFGMSQETIAQAVGKDRATVANYQRLLSLPDEVQAELENGTISMGHARALAGLPDQALQRQAARDIRVRDLSVRETEVLVKKLVTPVIEKKPNAVADVHTRDAEERLKRALGTRVRIARRRRGGGGQIELQFGSEDELQRIFEQLIS